MGSPIVGSGGRADRPLLDRGAHPAQEVEISRRVGFTPTPRSDRSASGWIAPATSQNAAADGSPGHALVDALHRPPSLDLDRRRRRPRSASSDRHAPRPEHALGVVSRRDRLANRRRARPPRRPASRIADFTCADGTGVVPVDRPERGATDHGEGRKGIVPARLEHARPSSAAAR